jgi:serine/threonine protein kinase
VHGDLKPQNILVSRNTIKDQRLYLIDFSISEYFLKKDRTHIHPTRGTHYKGTIAFSSPKKVLNLSNISGI